MGAPDRPAGLARRAQPPAHDVAAFDRLFLAAPTTVRYGLVEQHYGPEAIASWRRSSSPVHPRRTLEARVVTTCGTDTGGASTLFRHPDEPDRLDRQTRLRVRTTEGWRIGAAHGSTIAEPISASAP